MRWWQKWRIGRGEKNNLMVFGLLGCSEADTSEARLAADTVNISLVLKSIAPTMDVSTLRPQRLGKYNPA